jgi:hypothetical protein
VLAANPVIPSWQQCPHLPIPEANSSFRLESTKHSAKAMNAIELHSSGVERRNKEKGEEEAGNGY